MDFEGAAFADGVDLFVGFAFDVDSGDVEFEDAGDVAADLILAGAELGALEDDGGVDVADGPAGGRGTLVGFGEEGFGIGAGPLGIGVGEELADIGEGEGAEDGIGDRVKEGIAIGVGDGAAVGFEGDASENEGLAAGIFGAVDGGKAVEVVAVSDANREGLSLGAVGGGCGGLAGAAAAGTADTSSRVCIPFGHFRPCVDEHVAGLGRSE